jgi:hypothetical protein
VLFVEGQFFNQRDQYRHPTRDTNVYQRKTVIRQKLGIEEKGDIAEYLSTLSKKEPL